MRLAPSFDTIGWFAQDGATLRRVGQVLLGERAEAIERPRLLLAEDAFEQLDELSQAKQAYRSASKCDELLDNQEWRRKSLERLNALSRV